MKWLLATVFLCSILSPCCGQFRNPYFQAPTWKEDPAFFLEPNNFTIEKEMLDRSLWLRVGYGKSFYEFCGIAFGLEGLAWSRLETLSQFRFPVQTVDYFFGAYGVWKDSYAIWRLRISHISSHLVDGSDSISGGSSSKYSREFVELMREVPLDTGPFGDKLGFSWTLGLRAYFHQVTKIEPWVAVPATLRWRFADLSGVEYQDEDPRYSILKPISVFVSSGDGPVWPSIACGIRAERIALGLAALGMQLEYFYGASWAGTDAGAKVSQLKLQLDVRDF